MIRIGPSQPETEFPSTFASVLSSHQGLKNKEKIVVLNQKLNICGNNFMFLLEEN